MRYYPTFVFRLCLGILFAAWIAAGFSARAQSPSVHLTTPNGGECLTMGGPAWSVAWELDGAHHLDLYYSLTGNEADKQQIIHTLIAQTSYPWTPPFAYSVTARLFLYGHDASHAIIASDTTDDTFSIDDDCLGTGPVISNVQYGNVSASGAQVSWTTDVPSDSRVAYGTVSGSYTSLASARCDAGGYVTSHCVNVTGLAAGTTHYYKVKSRCAGGLEAQSGEYQFTSAAAGGSSASARMLPAALSGLSGSYLSGDLSGPSVSLQWIGDVAYATDLKLYQRLQADAWPVSPSHTYSSAGTASAKIPAPVSPGVYEYRMDACNALGCAASNIATVVIDPSATLSGTVRLEGKGVRAFVSAWSAKNGYAETESRTDGSYALFITRGEAWYVSASRVEETDLYRASAISVKTDAAVFVQDIVLLPVAEKLPGKISVSVDPQLPNTVSAVGGPQLTIPAGAITATGAATVTIFPVEQFTEQAGMDIVGNVYAVEVRDINAKPITALNAGITIGLPYTDAGVAAVGARPEDLAISYWDPARVTWVRLSASAADTQKRLVSGNIGHLTRFALVAPADTQPPDPPYNVSVARSEAGYAIAWSNPTYDFHHAKIYRSAAKGELGTLIFDNIAGTSKTDAASLQGDALYYTIRAIDLAGNESLNTTQYTVSGPTEKPSPKERGPQPIPTFSAASATSTTPSSQTPVYQKYPNGTLLRATGDAGVWVIMNGFKRLVVSQNILAFYGHLKSAKITDVPKAELDQYKLAAWVRYVNSPKVYEVNDDATKHWLDMSAEDFYNTGRRWEAVFVVNKEEVDFYATGANVVVMK